MPLSLRSLPLPFSRRTFVVAVVSIAALFFTSLFVYQVQARTLSQKGGARAASSVSSGTVYLSATAQAEAAAAMSVVTEAPMREVHIANNGLVLLRGATVVAKSRGTLRVSMEWSSMNFMWSITTDNDTKFLTSAGQKETLNDIEVGDTVTVTGQLIEGGSEPTVAAHAVRE